MAQGLHRQHAQRRTRAGQHRDHKQREQPRHRQAGCKLEQEQEADHHHGKGAHMHVLQDAQSLLAVPPGQQRVACVHVAVQVDEARDQEGIGRDHRRGQRQRQNRPRQMCDTQPDRADQQAHQRQAGRALFAQAVVPLARRQWDRDKHVQAHVHGRQHVLHSGSTPLWQITVPEETSSTVSQHFARLLSTRARPQRYRSVHSSKSCASEYR